MEPPPPVFSALPRVEAIQPDHAPHTYLVTLREEGGEPKTAVFTVWQGDIGGASADWDIFWCWPGDAESLRSVVRQVCEFDRREGDRLERD